MNTKSLLLVLCAVQCAAGAGNLVSNPSFENGTTGWNISGNCHQTVAPAGASDGAGFMVFNEADTAPNGRVWQTIPTVPGAVYVASFDFRSPQSGPAQIRFDVFDGAATSGSPLYTTTRAESVQSSWVSVVNLMFTAASATTTIVLSDKSDGTTSFDLHLDNVAIWPSPRSPRSVQVSVGVVVVQFETDAGFSYDVEASATLEDGSYKKIATVAGTGSIVTVVDKRQIAPKQFYRVRAYR